ncbi:DUF2795 domain-containing protein [Streptomyces sp. NPDC048639]|uniref:DUF2795 domain-containing protein n=1 Tax=Streptomyces sp. NPDC048639 TaxID=3365581 RepID=UPI00371E5044
MERGSNRLNVHRDDEMKHELQGLLRSGHPTRAEEWHDPEPAADDDPEVAWGPIPARGSIGDAETLRYELARHLARTPFPAKRRQLLHTLEERHAPDRLVEIVGDVPPHDTYRNVQEVVEALGRSTRT